MDFRFNNYNSIELQSCGEAFLHDVRRHGKSLRGTTAWTEHTLNWFSHAAADGHTVDARRSRRSSNCLAEAAPDRTCFGEFMVDLAHTTLPGYEKHDYYTRGYWLRTLENPCLVRLALESEMGKYGNPDYSFALIMEDATKVAVMRANVKIVIFASQPKLPASDVTTALQKLRHQNSDASPWLWIDLPWDPDADGVWRPSYGIQK